MILLFAAESSLRYTGHDYSGYSMTISVQVDPRLERVQAISENLGTPVKLFFGNSLEKESGGSRNLVRFYAGS
jgi:hypothetical protein